MAWEILIKKVDNYHVGEGQQSWHVLVLLLKDLNSITQHVEIYKLSSCDRNAVAGTINQLSAIDECETCPGTSSGQSSTLQFLSCITNP